jgi:hypothetical protein
MPIQEQANINSAARGKAGVGEKVERGLREGRG